MNHIIKIKPLIFILVLLVFSKSLFAQEWIGKILPMETKVSELQGIFDVTPEKKPTDTLFYKLKEGNLFVTYSLGSCKAGAWGAWNIEEGVIVSLVFYPKRKFKPLSFNLTFEGMEQGFDSGHQTYKSDAKGLYFSTQFGKVMRIHFYPSNRYKNLRCEPKIKLTRRAAGCGITTGMIGWAESSDK